MNFYTYKLENLEEMDKFLEIYNSPRLNKKETGSLNRPVISSKIDKVILKLPTPKKKYQDQMDSIWHSKKIGNNPSDTIPEDKEGILPKSFYKASITSIPTQGRT